MPERSREARSDLDGASRAYPGPEAQGGERTDVKTHRFLFIGGLHRSGTSILARCLSKHPLISGMQNTEVPEDEGQHLQSVYSPALAHGGPGRFGFDPAAHLTERSPLLSAAHRRRILSEWTQYWDMRRPVLLEKSPPNLIRMRFLQSLFPNSYFLIMIRHPICVSYATQKWSHTSISELIRHWLVCHELFERDISRIKRVLVLRYEQFVADTRSVLDQVYSFLDLPSYPNRVTVRDDLCDPYWDAWLEFVNGPETSDGASARFMRLRYEQRLNRLGYSLNEHATSGRGSRGLAEESHGPRPDGDVQAWISSSSA